MTSNVSIRTMKRLVAAEGYLDLGMLDRVHLELDAVSDDASAQEYIAYLRGEAFRAAGDIDRAVELLEQAARGIPAPFNRRVWRSLGDCYRQRGEEHLATFAESLAKASVPVLLVIVQQHQNRSGRSSRSTAGEDLD